MNAASAAATWQQEWFFTCLLAWSENPEKLALVRVTHACHRLGHGARLCPINPSLPPALIRPSPPPMSEYWARALPPTPEYWRLSTIRWCPRLWWYALLRDRPALLRHVRELWHLDLPNVALASQLLPHLERLTLYRWAGEQAVHDPKRLHFHSPLLKELELRNGSVAMQGNWPVGLVCSGLRSLQNLHLDFPPYVLDVQADDTKVEENADDDEERQLARAPLPHLHTFSCLLLSQHEASLPWPAWLVASPITTLRLKLDLVKHISLTGFERIKHLEIDSSQSAVDGTSISVCTQLVTVKLYGVIYLDLRPAFATLEQLSLRNCRLRGWIVDQRCARLETLKLTYNDAGTSWALDVESLPSLRSLELELHKELDLKDVLRSATLTSLALHTSRDRSCTLGACPALTSIDFMTFGGMLVPEPRAPQEEEKMCKSALRPLLPSLQKVTYKGNATTEGIDKLVRKGETECPRLATLHIKSCETYTVTDFPPSLTELELPNDVVFNPWSSTYPNITALSFPSRRAEHVRRMLELCPQVARLVLSPGKLTLLPAFLREAWVVAQHMKILVLRFPHEDNITRIKPRNVRVEACREAQRMFQAQAQQHQRRCAVSVHSVEEPTTINCRRCWYVPYLVHVPEPP